MKFSNKLEVQLFLTEIQEFDKLSTVDESYEPCIDEVATFLKARTPLVKKLKDYRKSSDQKTSWRKNRHKMMKGIKKFHRSVDGKRFHRKLGNFLATRITRQKSTSEDAYEMLMSKQEVLRGLTSAKQHLFVELDYYHTLDEQVEIEEMVTMYAIPLFQQIESKIILDKQLSDDDITFIFDITDKKHIIKCIAEKATQNVEKIENVWDSISNKLNDDKIDELDSAFYPSLTKELSDALNNLKEKK